MTTLELHDLPGCDIVTLSRCINLKALRIVACGVVAADCLNKLPNLQYVDLQVGVLAVSIFLSLV